MTLPWFVMVAIAGGVGAATRMQLDGIIRSRAHGPLPWGTITINLSGSLLLGLLTGLAASHLMTGMWPAVAGAGFLGGYTTFSTASFETIRLVQEGRWAVGSINGLGTIVGATAAAGLGLWVGALL